MSVAGTKAIRSHVLSIQASLLFEPFQPEEATNPLEGARDRHLRARRLTFLDVCRSQSTGNVQKARQLGIAGSSPIHSEGSSSWRRSRLRTLPAGLRGSGSSRNQNRTGTLKA